MEQALLRFAFVDSLVAVALAFHAERPEHLDGYSLLAVSVWVKRTFFSCGVHDMPAAIRYLIVCPVADAPMAEFMNGLFRR